MKGCGFSASLHYDVSRCLLHRFKRRIQRGDQVLHVLRADGQADRVGFDALVQQFIFRQLAVGGGKGWITRLFTSATLASREKIARLSINFFAVSLSPFTSKVKMLPPPFGKYF